MDRTTQQYTTSLPVSQAGSPLLALVPSNRRGVFSVRISGPFGFRYIGRLQGDTFSKTVKPEHVFHVVNGIGISAAVILSGELNFEWIAAGYSGQKLCTSREFFRAHAVPFQIRGFEPQLALPLPLWGIATARAWQEAEAKRQRIEAEKRAQTELFAA